MYRLISLAALMFCLTTILVPDQLVARDDGRFANSPLNQDGHYRVRIYGPWLVVPDAAVITEPNRFGPAVVWPYNDRYGNTQIRCFMPGAGT